MIRLAADVASERLASHYQRVWIGIDQRRCVKFACPHGRPSKAFQANVDQLFRDTEEVISHIWAEIAKP